MLSWDVFCCSNIKPSDSTELHPGLSRHNGTSQFAHLPGHVIHPSVSCLSVLWEPWLIQDSRRLLFSGKSHFGALSLPIVPRPWMGSLERVSIRQPRSTKCPASLGRRRTGPILPAGRPPHFSLRVMWRSFHGYWLPTASAPMDTSPHSVSGTHAVWLGAARILVVSDFCKRGN